jgi:nucleotide-binding universal stress UspA family protein
MTAPVRSLLLCTNGAPEGVAALTYGAWLAQVVHLHVTLLGIVETQASQQMVEGALREAQTQLEAQGVAYTTLRREGRARDVISTEAKPGYHLVVIGPLGRPLWRQWLQGRSARRLMPRLVVPLLFAPTAHCQIDRILVATGALELAAGLECCALQLARKVGAALTILHVVPKTSYSYPIADEIEAQRDDFLQADVPQARNLRALLKEAQAIEVAATVEIRHGTIVHEIIDVARRGQYDLVVMGSRHSSHTLRSSALPDVTAEVMATLAVPVLSVQASQTCILAK